MQPGSESPMKGTSQQMQKDSNMVSEQNRIMDQIASERLEIGGRAQSESPSANAQKIKDK